MGGSISFGGRAGTGNGERGRVDGTEAKRRSEGPAETETRWGSKMSRTAKTISVVREEVKAYHGKILPVAGLEDECLLHSVGASAVAAWRT